MLLEVIFQLCALLVIAGTFLSLIRNDSWLIRGWDFPRIQLLCLGVFTLLGLFLLSFKDAEWGRDLVIVLALSLALGALVFWLRPYTRLHRKQVLNGDGKTGIKTLVSNVLMTNRESDGLLAMIRKHEPDLIIALETDHWWTRQIAAVSDKYPYAVEVPQNDTYGMVLRSRLPLSDPRVEYIVRKNIPSIHTGIELENGTVINVHALHPKPPFPDEDDSSTDRDAELLTVGKRVRKDGGPTLVLGDMNDVAWSRTTKLFQKTSGLLDPRVGRGFFPTFHASYAFMRWPLDHVFVSDHFRVRDLQRLPFIGSDHFPMFTDFSFEPGGQDEQETLSTDADEKAEVEEKISAPEPKRLSEITSPESLREDFIQSLRGTHQRAEFFQKRRRQHQTFFKELLNVP
ncbi:MAG: endonuclease/exonuclease/phosphatase family protein [Luteolibacter sp.]